MANDVPPLDPVVLTAIARVADGMTPTQLIEELCGQGYTRENTILAIQRVLDRGLVELTDNARLASSEKIAA